jgi:Acyl-CoA thioester hydrolase/BAAT N-terminal region
MAAAIELPAPDALGPAGSYPAHERIAITDVAGDSVAELSLLPRLFVTVPCPLWRGPPLLRSTSAWLPSLAPVRPTPREWSAAFQPPTTSLSSAASPGCRSPTRTRRGVWARRGDAFAVHAPRPRRGGRDPVRFRLERGGLDIGATNGPPGHRAVAFFLSTTVGGLSASAALPHGQDKLLASRLDLNRVVRAVPADSVDHQRPVIGANNPVPRLRLRRPSSLAGGLDQPGIAVDHDAAGERHWQSHRDPVIGVRYLPGANLSRPSLARSTPRAQTLLRRMRIAMIALLGLLVVGCGGGHTRATLTVTPRRSLADRPLRVVARGLPANRSVVLAATWTTLAGDYWRSSQTLRADHEGTVVLSGIDGMRFLWAMHSAARPKAETEDVATASPRPGQLTVSISDRGHVLARTTDARRFGAPGVQMRRLSVRQDGIYGYYFAPRGVGRSPAVLAFGGSEGGWVPHAAAKRLF